MKFQRHVLFISAYLICASGWIATAQTAPDFQCVASQGAPTLVRVEGRAEYAGDLLVFCFGGVAGRVRLANVILKFGPSPTSRVLSGTLTEAVLIIDEAQPGQQVLGKNIFQGEIDQSSLLVFRNVPITEPGMNQLLWRISDLRLDASTLGVSTTLIPTQIQTEIAVAASDVPPIFNRSQIAAFITTGLFLSYSTQPTEQGRAIGLTFRKGYAQSFKVRGSSDQTLPGYVYNTEGGFVPTLTGGGTIPGVGVATQGTRLMGKIQGLPPDAVVSVPAAVKTCATGVQLLSGTDSTGAGGELSAGTGSLPIAVVNGTALVVYEVVEVDPFVVDFVTIPVSIASGGDSSSATASGFLAPISAASVVPDATTPTPRFVDIAHSPSAPSSSFPTCRATGLAFEYVIGSKLPAPGSITVGGGVGSYTATADQGWIHISAGNGIFPAALTISADPTGFQPGIYKGSVNVSAAGGSTTIPVSLTVDNGPLLIKEIRPSSVIVGSAPVTLTISGSNFLPGLVVSANSTPLQSTFVDTSTLSAVIPANLLAQNGQLAIRVANPATGQSQSTQFTVLADPTLPQLTSSGVVNAASYQSKLAPGAIAIVFGSQLASSTQSASSLPLSKSLAGAKINFTVNGAPISLDATIFYASPSQINFLLPSDLPQDTTAQLTFTRDGKTSAPVAVSIAPEAPAVFTVDGSGRGQGHIYKALGSGSQVLASGSAPAAAGDTVVIYCEGLGPVDFPVDDGFASPTSPPARTLNAVKVSMGGVAATVIFSGLTPGSVGLYQVNAKVPGGVTPGKAVPVVVTVDRQDSPAVTMAVQ